MKLLEDNYNAVNGARTKKSQEAGERYFATHHMAQANEQHGNDVTTASEKLWTSWKMRSMSWTDRWRTLLMSDALIAPAKCFVPVINMDRAFEKLHKREKDISAYKLIMSIADSPGNPAFQRKYTGFYRLRRNEEWRREYFRLMDFFGKSGEPTFEEILLCLYQATGNIECSFSSKMLATINPDMPIWDSKVLKALQLRLKGKDPETRISNAVVLYESICHWYEVFLQTKTGKDMIQRFDREFPKFKDIPVTKKVDFILWAS